MAKTLVYTQQLSTRIYIFGNLEQCINNNADYAGLLDSPQESSMHILWAFKTNIYNSVIYNNVLSDHSKKIASTYVVYIYPHKQFETISW